MNIISFNIRGGGILANRRNICQTTNSCNAGIYLIQYFKSKQADNNLKQNLLMEIGVYVEILIML